MMKVQFSAAFFTFLDFELTPVPIVLNALEHLPSGSIKCDSQSQAQSIPDVHHEPQ